MSKNKFLGVVVVLLISIFSFASCELEEEGSTVSIGERIEKFEDDLNAGATSSITDNFHPDMVSIVQANWYGIFQSGPLSNIPVNFGSPSSIVDGSVAGEKIATGVMIDVDDASVNYEMIFKEESIGDDVWLIKAITLNNLDYLSGISQ